MVLSPFRQPAEQTACIIKSVYFSRHCIVHINPYNGRQLFHTLNAPAFRKKRCKDIN